MKNRRLVLQALSAIALAGAFPTIQAQAPITLLNVSYDPTRELYVESNAAFAKHWKATSGPQNIRWCAMELFGGLGICQTQVRQ